MKEKNTKIDQPILIQKIIGSKRTLNKTVVDRETTVENLENVRPLHPRRPLIQPLLQPHHPHLQKSTEIAVRESLLTTRKNLQPITTDHQSDTKNHQKITNIRVVINPAVDHARSLDHPNRQTLLNPLPLNRPSIV
jgi:hypothetical protein